MNFDEENLISEFLPKTKAGIFFWKLKRIILWPYYHFYIKIKLKKISLLHDELSKKRRVDIFPGYGNGRGFIIIFDQKEALYFNQDGDHFVYDGCETGEYEKGNVTIFDNIKN